MVVPSQRSRLASLRWTGRQRLPTRRQWLPSWPPTCRFSRADVVARLLDACTGDGAVLVDDRGRDQYLAGVWRVTALRKALDEFGDPAGGAMRRLVAELDITRVGGGSQTPAPWFDCDDPQDLDEAKRRARAHE